MSTPTSDGCFEDTVQLRKHLIDTCRTLQQLGYVIGTWGNVAVRVRDGLLVTPTRLGYDVMTPDDLVVASLDDGSVVRGTRLPTSEVHLHRHICNRRDDLHVLIHNHSPQATAVAVMGLPIPCIAEDQAQILGGAIPCSRYVVSSRHQDFARAAADALGDTAAAVLLANHGVVVGARDLDEALAASRVLEKTATMFLLARAGGSVTTLDDDTAAEERHRYLHKYGTADDFHDPSATSA